MASPSPRYLRRLRREQGNCSKICFRQWMSQRRRKACASMDLNVQDWLENFSSVVQHL
ncbi:unnamed protein product [Rhodiola kirilowii]